VKKRLAENRISLNIEKRKTEIEEDKARKERRTAERAKIKPADEKRYSVTLDNVSKPELQVAKNEKKSANEKGAPGEPKEAKPINPALDGDEDDEDEKPEVDAVRTEALAILTDFVDLTRNPKSATAAAK
jgi:hypothetical protein